MSAPEPSWPATLVPAFAGLIGVLLGSATATLKDWWFSRRNDKRDAHYLAVQVVGQLDRYIFACSEVVTDDGLCKGERDGRGNLQAQVSTPRFSPETLTVEWRSIPADLMYEILDLPFKARVADHIIEGASENADPPDFEDYYEERQLQYAKLGLLASDIATRLRKRAALPERSIAHWDPIEFLTRARNKIEASRTERATQWELKLASRDA